MVQIQVAGPAHAKKGYIIVEITRLLRELGCEVHLQGEETHLVDKVMDLRSREDIAQLVRGVEVTITELRTPS